MGALKSVGIIIAGIVGAVAVLGFIGLLLVTTSGSVLVTVLMVMGAVVLAAGAAVLVLRRSRSSGAPVGAPVLPRAGGGGGVRPGVWIGIVHVVVAVAIMPLWWSSSAAIALSLFGLLPSGALFIIMFSLRVKGRRLSTLRYRLIAPAATWAFGLVVVAGMLGAGSAERADVAPAGRSMEYVMLVRDAAAGGWEGGSVEAAAAMVAGEARVDCDVLKEGYAMVKTKVDGVFRGVGTSGIGAGPWAQGVTALYDDECYSVYLPALARGDRNVPYRLNDEIRVRLMVLDAYPVDCEILGDAAQAAKVAIGFAAFVGAYEGYAQDKRIHDYYTSMRASGVCG